jgi:para-aminobenzoate synthetase component 1
MLTWASPFNICCFLDNHSYASSPSTFECLLAVGAVDSFSAPAGEAFAGLKQWAAGQEDWLLGHFGYGLTIETEGVADSLPDPIGFPDCFFFRPAHLILLQKDSVRIGSLQDDPSVIWRQICATRPIPGPAVAPAAAISPAAAASPAAASPVAAPSSAAAISPAAAPSPAAPSPAAPASVAPFEFIPRFSKDEYLATIEALRRHILRGDCYEINFCQEFYAQPAEIDPYATWWALSQASPNPFAAFYRLDQRYLLCASPERFLKKTGLTLSSQPIKGTAPRQREDAVADSCQREGLYQSAKDRPVSVSPVRFMSPNSLASMPFHKCFK